jgi:threonine dehydrogenase-like Zn-dependent dehydrogenase
MLTHLFPLDDYRQAVYTAVDKRNTQSVKVAFDMGDI